MQYWRLHIEPPASVMVLCGGIRMTNEDRTRAIAWFEKQSKCLAMPGAAKMFGLAAEALNEGQWIAVS